MHIHPTIAGLREALTAERRQGKRIVFVPTMGNLHAGHIALMTHARAHGDIVVASIFVNRLQFGPNEDFDQYPRTFEADCQQLMGANVDYLFAPNEQELYPTPQQYTVEPNPAHVNILEGAARPGHFGGVATVVLKLFNIVQPDAAVFGKKDYQQVMVIRNLVREMALPIEIVRGETVRAEDGLALSSRNGYLTPEQRAEAPRLSAELRKIRAAIQAGERDFAKLEAAAMAELSAHGWQPDYITVRRQLDLQLPQGGADEELVVIAACRLGTPRLLDNLEI